jgi:hypothetical protein
MALAAIWLGASRRLPSALDSLIVSAMAGFVERPSDLTLGPPVVDSTPTFVDFSLSPRTVLIVVRSDCRFCTASKPFYAELLRREQGMPHAVRIFLVGPTTDSGFSDYLTDLGFAPDRRLQISATDFHVVGTPTVLLFNQEGRVENSWLGKLAIAEEAGVLDEIFRLPRASGN